MLYSNEFMELFKTSTRTVRGNQWLIGDTLLIGCPMGDNRDQKYRTECQEFLNGLVPVCKEDGLRYSTSRLREFRNISHLYPLARRRAGVGYEVHVIIRSPETLDFIIKTLPEGQELTKQYAKSRIKVIHAVIPDNMSPSESLLNSHANSFDLTTNAMMAQKLANDTEKMLSQRKFHESADDAILNAVLRAHQAWLNIANRMLDSKKSKHNQQPYLSVVGS